MKTIKELKEEKQRMEAEILERIEWLEKEYNCGVSGIEMASLELPTGETKPMKITLNIRL